VGCHSQCGCRESGPGQVVATVVMWVEADTYIDYERYLSQLQVPSSKDMSVNKYGALGRNAFLI